MKKSIFLILLCNLLFLQAQENMPNNAVQKSPDSKEQNDSNNTAKNDGAKNDNNKNNEKTNNKDDAQAQKKDDNHNAKKTTLLDFSNPQIAKEVAKQCDAIFEARKEEINTNLIRLKEQQDTIALINAENTKLLNQKQEKLNAQEKALRKMYADMKAEASQNKQENDSKLKTAKDILAKNEKILANIKEQKDNKLSESYAKMKDANAAGILSQMDSKDAIDILLTLQAKQMGLILSKMAPEKAAELTEMLHYYPNKKPLPPTAPPAAKNDGIVLNPNNDDKNNPSPGNKPENNNAPTNFTPKNNDKYKVY